jgi:hypothetical protein
MKRTKLANFDNPKWTYRDLCFSALKYRIKIMHDPKIKEKEDLLDRLYRYNSQPRKALIANLKEVQKYLYK